MCSADAEVMDGEYDVAVCEAKADLEFSRRAKGEMLFLKNLVSAFSIPDSLLTLINLASLLGQGCGQPQVEDAEIRETPTVRRFR